MQRISMIGVLSVALAGAALGQPWSNADVPAYLGGLTDFICVPLEFTGVQGAGAPQWPYVTGSQTGRLTRDAAASVCGTLKMCPGVFTTSGSRRYDAYTF